MCCLKLFFYIKYWPALQRVILWDHLLTWKFNEINESCFSAAVVCWGFLVLLSIFFFLILFEGQENCLCNSLLLVYRVEGSKISDHKVWDIDWLDVGCSQSHSVTSLFSCTGEKKHNERLMSWVKDRERSLTNYCHEQTWLGDLNWVYCPSNSE